MEMTKKQAALIYNAMTAVKIVGATHDDVATEETAASMAAKLWDGAPWVGTSDAALTATDPANYNVVAAQKAAAFLRQIADALEKPHGD